MDTGVSPIMPAVSGVFFSTLLKTEKIKYDKRLLINDITAGPYSS